MADTVTTTLGLTKPEVGASEDSWGEKINTNFDLVDDALDGTTAVSLDINGGTIDGAVIGGATPAAITGTAITGTSFATSGNMTFGDNDKAIFGAGSDLQIYHSGTNSDIDEVGTGNLRIGAENFVVQNADHTENMISAAPNGQVVLYYDNSIKFNTSNTGVDITGTLTSDGLTVDGDAVVQSAEPRFILGETDVTGQNTRFRNTGGDLQIQTVDDAYFVATNRISLDHATGDISFYEDTGTTPKFFWDASAESLGIGTSSPLSTIHLNTTGGGSVYFQDSDATSTYNISEISNNAGNFGIQTRNSSGTFVSTDYQIVKNASGADYHRWFTQGSERMRLDASGNLLVGTTSTDPRNFSSGTYGIRLSDSQPEFGIGTMYINRSTGTDGDLISFRKDGSTVGRIGANGGALYIGGLDNNYGALRFNNSPRAIVPAEHTGATYDNSVDLGQSAVRFDDIYATNGTIQTSDRNEKQDIEALSDAEQRVAVACKGLLRKFRWKDAVAKKGDDARIHFGIIAQDLQDAFAAEGLDAGRYAMFISSTWTDEETGEERTRMGVRYPELLAFIIAAI